MKRTHSIVKSGLLALTGTAIVVTALSALEDYWAMRRGVSICLCNLDEPAPNAESADAPTPHPLASDAPQKLTVNNTNYYLSIQWQPVPNAEGYFVTLYDELGQASRERCDTNSFMVERKSHPIYRKAILAEVCAIYEDGHLGSVSEYQFTPYEDG